MTGNSHKMWSLVFSEEKKKKKILSSAIVINILRVKKKIG